MRWLIALMLIVPTVAATTWDDDAADQRVGYPTHYEDGEPQYHWIDAGEQGWYTNLDLVSATVSETPTDLVFTVATTSADENPPPDTFVGPAFDEYVHAISFDFRDVEYTVAFFEDFFGEGPVIAEAWVFDFGGRTVMFPSFPYAPATPLDGGGWTGQLPKEYFRDSALVPVREGDQLENIRVFAQENDFFGRGIGITPPCPDASTQDPPSSGVRGFCRWHVEDILDTGASYEVTKTPPGVGHIFLRMEEPFRLSNGLATTYLFEADLRNLEEIKDSVVLQVSDVPKDWEIRLPAAVEFTGKAAETIPVAVTVPFSHEHGANHIMTLSAISQTNESAIVESRFGVFFADPPQPAGHHDTLSFFGYSWCPEDFGGNCDEAYMNAGTEPLDFGGRSSYRDIEEVEGSRRFYNFDDPSSQSQPAVREWEVRLSPGLGIGLDFDVSEQGRFLVDLKFEDAWDATVTAELALAQYLEDRVQYVRLASGSAEASFGAGDTQTVDIPLDIEPAADLIPFNRAQNLVLFINATDTSGLPYNVQQGDAYLVVDDTTMTLPLLDFHEKVDLTGLDFADLTIRRLNDTHKYVNPGNTTVFSFEVGNAGGSDVTVDWEIVVREDQASWAKVTPAVSHVPGEGNATVVVRVTAPADAEEGDTAEILLVGTERGTKTPLYGRMTAAVTDTFEIPDESLEASELEKEAERSGAAKESPVPLWLAFAALALLARRR